MKKNLILAVVLALFASAASADAQKPEFSWIGVGHGTGFTSVSTTPTISSANTYLSVRGGHGWALDRDTLVGFELSFLGGPQKIVAIPSIVGMFALDDRNIFALVPHCGYSQITGNACGVDFNVGLMADYESSMQILAGVTRFSKDLGGNKNLFQVGIQRFF